MYDDFSADYDRFVDWPARLAVELPFEALSRFGGFKIAPASGTRWRANFYRIGGRTDVQYGCWNWNDSEKPDYHQSKYFGNVWFE